MDCKMPRYLDRYLQDDEWESFLAEVKLYVERGEAPDHVRLQKAYGLSQRTTKRTIRRAEKFLDVECSVPPEISRRKACVEIPEEDIEADMTPLQRLAGTIDWRYMTVIEKAKQILPGRVSETRLGYTLDGRLCRISEIVGACNDILETEGLNALPR
jgi:hypothetical protein